MEREPRKDYVSSMSDLTNKDPLLRDSKRSCEHLTGTMRYHTQITRGRWTYCGCAPVLSFTNKRPNTLGRNRRKYDKWASA